MSTTFRNNSYLNRWPVTPVTFGGSKYFFNVWESIGKKMLSTFLHSSWERGRVSLIF